MNALKKISLVFLTLVVLLILIALGYSNHLAKKGLPDYKKNLHMTGLISPVNVYRDALGIPHIFAGNEQDLYMATGYIMAQERIWQMDLLRRVTLGRLSEIFGDDMAETDLLLRSLRYSDKSHEILKNTDPKSRAALVAFTDGVNQYLKANKGNYPLEFSLLGYTPEKWEPYQSLNLIGYMAWDLKSGWSELLFEKLATKLDSAHYKALLPSSSNLKATVYRKQTADLLASNALLNLQKLDKMGLDIFNGSNNWAVAPSKSKTGSPIVANDMHLSLNVPGIWFQIHQYVKDTLDVEGLALPGEPLVIVGHNDSIAWGMTNTYVDNLDYYEERVNPDDSNQYWFNGQWHNFKVHEEIIKSKSGKTFKRFYRLDHRGPVVSAIKKIKDRVLTICWVGDVKSNELLAVYKVNHAHNWNEFKNAFRTFRSISQNVVYADRRGNIGMYCCAGIPIRKRDKIFAVLPGDTSEYDWQGLVPFDELPHEYNPARGYVSSANNRTVDSTYPYHIGTWYAQPYRIERIREMLESKGKLDVQDFQVMQNDQHSKFSQLFLHYVLPSLNSYSGWNAIERTALQMLNNWDYNMDAESPEATISEFMSWHFLKNTFEDEMDTTLFEEFTGPSNISHIAMYNLLNDTSSVWLDDVNTPQKRETRADIAIKSFKEAVADITDREGHDTTRWKWGNFHTLTLRHPLTKVEVLDKIFHLNRGPFPVGGSYHTVSVYAFPLFEPDKTDHGSSHRNIYDLANWDNSCSVIPTGNSGVCKSRFYCNQTKMYIAGEYHPDYYSTEAVKDHAKYSMEFLP